MTLKNSPSIRRLAAPVLAAAALAAALAAHADATLDRIKSRGSVAVGVVINGGPFGSVDPASRRFVGWNPELARQLARDLGVDVELVQVQPSNRVQFLQTGKVDLLVASMEWTEERGKILGFAPTPFYKVGAAAVTLSSSGIAKWEDLRGKPVCVSQGSNYARPLGVQYGAQVKGFRGSAESLLALRGGHCVAAVHDATLIHPLVQSNPDWKDYRAPIADALTPSSSVVWTRPGEADTIAAVDHIVREWHRSGWLIETERRLGITPPLQELVELRRQHGSTAAPPPGGAPAR